MSDNNSKPVPKPVKPVFPQDSIVKGDDFIVPMSKDNKR
jgi:hypothetical protein